jgi:hypothetical protein
MGWRAGFRFPADAGGFPFLQSVQTGSGARQISYPTDTEGSSSGVKRPRREADNSHPSIPEVKNGGAIIYIPHISSLRGA